MTILIADAKHELVPSGTTLSDHLPVHELLYADDTLFVEADEISIQQYMNAAANACTTYGLSLNWSKVEVLATGCSPNVVGENSHIVAQKDRMVYLGSVRGADGNSG